jgi:hypothetical protein
MKRTALLLLCTMTLFCTRSVFSQANKDSMMKAWAAYMTPSDVHKMIASSDGVWNTSMTMWMDPNGKPVTSTGTCTNKMVMGGRYQESTFAGNFMGMPMEGKGTLAYDNAKKVFQSTWIDNMGTGIMFTTGTWDDPTKTINFSGMMTDPMTGKDVKMRETFKIVDDKNQLMTMYTVPEGGTEYKSMEIKFAKKS